MFYLCKMLILKIYKIEVLTIWVIVFEMISWQNWISYCIQTLNTSANLFIAVIFLYVFFCIVCIPPFTLLIKECIENCNHHNLPKYPETVQKKTFYLVMSGGWLVHNNLKTCIKLRIAIFKFKGNIFLILKNIFLVY